MMPTVEEVALNLRTMERPNWPVLTQAVLGRNGTREEVVQRLSILISTATVSREYT